MYILQAVISRVTSGVVDLAVPSRHGLYNIVRLYIATEGGKNHYMSIGAQMSDHFAGFRWSGWFGKGSKQAWLRGAAAWLQTLHFATETCDVRPGFINLQFIVSGTVPNRKIRFPYSLGESPLV